MLSFINNQTDWYKEKQKALEKARVEMLKQSKEGRYKLALRAEKAFNTAKNIISMATIIANHFSPNHFERPEVKKANEMLKEIEKIIAADVSFKRKLVYPSGGYQSEYQPNNPTQKEFIFNHKKQ